MGGGGGGAGMGNFSSVTGRTAAGPVQGGRASVRSGVFGMFGTKGAERLDDVEEGSDGFGRAEGKTGGGVTPVYEVRNGRMEMRESLSGLNGLSQNRWNDR
jgi:hypothetical protein